MKMIEIFFEDLKPKKQKELLEAFGINSPEEANWDVTPLAILIPPESEDYVNDEVIDNEDYEENTD